ncbi:MAG: cupin domain-containing protein [Proteobacteria bacterium]|nr:cupin domain-containing protein [Pseudomonadota bacterium]
MKLTRFHDNEHGVSVFSDIEVALPDTRSDAGWTFHLSRALGAVNVLFVELPVGLDQDWHPAPNRQFVIVLSGRLEVEVAGGARREWGAGEVFMADDTRGQGHLTRVLEGPVRLMFVCLPDDFELELLGG